MVDFDKEVEISLILSLSINERLVSGVTLRRLLITGGRDFFVFMWYLS